MKLADEVLDLRKAALALTPSDHPEIYHYKFDLAASLSDRFNDTGIVEYLRSATSLYRDVIQSLSDICSDGLPTKHDLLLSYALRTQVLFLATHRQEDIDTSIAAFIEYTNAIPDEHRARKLARCFYMTAGAMLDRHAQFPSVDTLDKAFALLEQSSRVPNAIPWDSFHASIVWADEAHQYHHPSEIEAYKRAFTIYPQFIWFGYGLRIRHSRLRASSQNIKLPALAAECAIRYGRLEQAVEWLDEGRSMLWGQMSDLRVPLNNLRSLYPALVARFEAAGQALEEAAHIDEVPSESRPGTTQPYSRLDISDVSDLKALRIAEWDHTLNDIRAIPQFSTFLMPRKYSELKEISSRGPVFIVNLSLNHSDALILPSPQEAIIHITLPGMTSHRALQLKRQLLEALKVSGRHVRDSRHVARHENVDTNAVLCSILAELWYTVAKPILARIGLLVSY